MEQNKFTDPIIDSAKTGDARALEKLWRTYAPVARRSAAKYLNEPGEIDQASTQGLSKAILNLEKWSGTGPFDAWVAQVVRNETIDWIRVYKDKVKSFSDIDGFDQIANSQLSDKAALRLIFGMIGKLPARQRMAVSLVLCEGMTYKSAAAIMGTTIGSVKANVYDARSKLQNRLTAVGLR